MDAEQVISMYQELSDLSGQMLACARSGAWDDLAELEARCARRLDALRAGEPLTALSGSSRERKVRIIHQIMANDRALRDLVVPWMAQLGRLIASTGTERKLVRAYGAA